MVLQVIGWSHKTWPTSQGFQDLWPSRGKSWCFITLYRTISGERQSSANDEQTNESVSEWMCTKQEVWPISVQHEGHFLQIGWFWVGVHKRFQRGYLLNGIRSFPELVCRSGHWGWIKCRICERASSLVASGSLSLLILSPPHGNGLKSCLL